MVGKGGSGSLGHGEDLSNQLLPKKIEVWSSPAAHAQWARFL